MKNKNREGQDEKEERKARRREEEEGLSSKAWAGCADAGESAFPEVCASCRH